MDREEKDRWKRYGDLVAAFASGPNTNQILTDYFNNLRSAFGFSPEFVNKALCRFPVLSIYREKLTQEERGLLDVLVKKNEILETCQSAAATGNFLNVEYNPTNQIFTIIESLYDVGGIEDRKFLETLVPKSEIQDFIDDMDIYEDALNDLKRGVDELIDISITIEKIAPQSTSRFQMIEEMARAYPGILKLHDYVKHFQESLKDVLLQIVKADRVYESEGFKKVLARYNLIRKKGFRVENNNLIEIGPFTENLFLNEEFYPSRERMFNEPIAYCLVEFLKEKDARNYLRKCHHCQKFYIASRIIKNQKRCSVCSPLSRKSKEESAAYMGKYRQEQKKKRKKEMIETKIKRLMDEGYNRKQATELAMIDE